MKVYKSSFNAMCSAVTQHSQPCRMKLVSVGEEEKIVSLYGIGFGMDEIRQGFANQCEYVSLTKLNLGK